VKLEKLIDPAFQTALSELSANKTVPPQIAFRLRGILKKVREELEKFEEVRKSYLEELAKKDAEGKIETSKEGLVSFEGNNEEEMRKRIKELGQAEVELPTVKFSELGSKFEGLTGFAALALDGLLLE